jgi:DNA topoisomerase-3
MKVILTEKPSVAKDIARVLKAQKRQDGYFEGNGYFVTWAYGHLIQLVYPENYDDKYKKWRMADLPIIPDTFIKEIINDKGVKKQFKTIKELMKNKEVNEIICATDAGREGELIFRFIYEEAKCKKPIKRLWISSQTDQAILEGFANLREGSSYVPLFHSAISRTEADWLVGINASRAYTIKFSYGSGVLSVGRVQTPVLKMIVDRYYENVNFKPTPYYELFVDIQHENGEFKGKWFDKDTDRILEKEKAAAILKEVQAHKQGAIVSTTKKEKREKQPLLYDLTELQKDANKRFKFSADKTLKTMQDLYEKHKVLTYPRTSSRYLSKDMVPKLPSLIKNLTDHSQYGDIAQKLSAQKLKTSKRIVDDKKVTDHHAIIPTEKKADISQFSPDEAKIFDLVIKRFLSVFLDECIKDITQIISKFSSHQFKTTGVIIRKAGWRAVYLQDLKEENTKEKEEEQSLPNVTKNDPINQKQANLEEKMTKAPPLHNEASILGAMETAGKQIEDEELREAMKDCGLGTPATRAQILERLCKVGYITREKNKLIPTQKGCQLLENIQDPALLSAELTGDWEKKLNLMSQNKYTRTDYMKEIQEFTKQVINNLQGQDGLVSRVSLGTCPICAADIIETPKGYSCANWKERGCKFVIWKTIAGKVITKQQAQQLLQEHKTDVIKGFKSRAGKKFDAMLVIKDNQVSFAFDNTPQEIVVIGKCPKCGSDVIERVKAYSCKNWQETGCDFVIFKAIARKEITQNIAKELIQKGKTPILKGFKSKANKAFEAGLELQEGKVKMYFN